MSGIFPQDYDGGLPANPNTPNDPTQAFLHRNKLPVDTAALYYGNGCDVRLRPHVINSLISEIAAIADRALVGYRASSLQNLELSTRYLIQRGLPRAALIVAQNPWFYAGTADPPPMFYNDFMTFTFVPVMPPGDVQNQGYVRIDLNGLGYAPLYREDGMEMESGDLKNLKPFIAVYFQGAWYKVGITQSQVPILKPGLDAWVRTDGNDITGDGTDNRPDKAFRTIDGAWAAVGNRYAITPSFTVNFKLGIPGTYETPHLGPFGANMSITGGYDGGYVMNPARRQAYRFPQNWEAGSGGWGAMLIANVNNIYIDGVTIDITQTSGGRSVGLWYGGSRIELYNVDFDVWASAPNIQFIYGGGPGGVGNGALGVVTFNGHGNTVGNGIFLQNGMYYSCGDVRGATWLHLNYHCASSWIHLMQVSNGQLTGMNMGISNVSGMQFSVTENSVFHGAGRPVPGNVAGTLSDGGVFKPG